MLDTFISNKVCAESPARDAELDAHETRVGRFYKI
jgi:hypothetical protein